MRKAQIHKWLIVIIASACIELVAFVRLDLNQASIVEIYILSAIAMLYALAATIKLIVVIRSPAWADYDDTHHDPGIYGVLIFFVCLFVFLLLAAIAAFWIR